MFSAFMTGGFRRANWSTLKSNLPRSVLELCVEENWSRYSGLIEYQLDQISKLNEIESTDLYKMENPERKQFALLAILGIWAIHLARPNYYSGADAEEIKKEFIVPLDTLVEQLGGDVIDNEVSVFINYVKSIIYLYHRSKDEEYITMAIKHGIIAKELIEKSGDVNSVLYAHVLNQFAYASYEKGGPDKLECAKQDYELALKILENASPAKKSDSAEYFVHLSTKSLQTDINIHLHLLKMAESSNADREYSKKQRL